MTTYTKDDLRRLHGLLTRIMQPGKPLTPEDVVRADVAGLLAKTTAAIANERAAIERGAKVFEWRIPTGNAPTMNSWGFMKTWQRARIRKELEAALQPILEATPGAKVHGLATMRWVRVTRFTPNAKTVDESAVDSIGGKMPIDVLVRAGVLAGDSPRYLRREARVEPTKRGNTHVLIEVFEVAEDEVPAEPATDGAVVQIDRQYGPMTQAVLGEGTGPSPERRPRVLPFGE